MDKRRLEKLKFFERKIDDFFRHAGREHLPWRKRGITPYEVWVSEIMLQQTQVSRVIGYYERFLARFPTVESLAAATWEEFLPYYRGLGYYARGRNMLEAAKTIVSEHGGIFPRDVRGLEALPGVGPYTAAAIASFAFGNDTVAWDTNLRRVVGRFFFGSKRADIPFTEFEEAFRLPAKELNAALMDFGSAICVARPKCGACPVRDRCRYLKVRGKSELTTDNSQQTTEESKVARHSTFSPKGDRPPADKIQDSKFERSRWKHAQVMLFLHEGHRTYYSSKRSGYAPFIVPATHNTRAGIKDRFRVRYGLELAVRPPHGKIVIAGKPTILVNAQILLGAPDFPTFGRDAWEAFIRSLSR